MDFGTTHTSVSITYLFFYSQLTLTFSVHLLMQVLYSTYCSLPFCLYCNVFLLKYKYTIVNKIQVVDA